jgi:membrane protein DedA with SNARE-associated domain
MYGGMAGLFRSCPSLDPLLAAFLFIVLAEFALPIPEEAALILAGLALRGSGRGYLAALPVGVAALALVDATFFSAARLLGPRLTRSRIFRLLSDPRGIRRAEARMRSRGLGILFASRLVVGLRLAAILCAGSLRLPLRRFIAADFPALALCAAAWLGVGYSVGPSALAEAGALGRALSLAGPIALAATAFLLRRIVLSARMACGPESGAS